MSKLSFFFHQLIQSATSLTYYNSVLKARLLSSVKFFSFFLFITMVLSIIIPALLALPFMPKAMNELEKLYPQNLEVNISNGEISTNQPEPYYLFEDKDSVAIIDTTGGLIDIPFGKTGVLITKNKIITRDTNGFEEKSYNLSEFKQNLTINKSLVNTLFEKIKPVIVALAIIFFILFFPFLFLMLLLLTLLYVLFVTIFPLVISRALNLGLSYKNLLKISLHAFALPKLLQIIFGDLLKVNFPPFSFTLIYLAFITIILTTINKKQQNV